MGLCGCLLVDKDFGTGVLKISPGHDHNDYNLARKLGLPILNVMNKDGTLNNVAGLYCGLDRFEARKKLWADLEETALAVKKEPHTLRVPRSQRGGENDSCLAKASAFPRFM
ncbi:Leucine-tRNA ligase, archaeal [Trema orientale]|uniref:valine--tRNA ligase n=1 Tax=Trema orientale TaxID=63057 RepID=A0A2P5D1J6_TREOI|nr:Leucine-tRNA ligase, archaeal [Trema orientale]